MPFVGVGPYYPSAVAGVGASNRSLVTALPAVNNAQTCNFAATTTQREILVQPGVAGSTTAPTEGTPMDFGWNILAADMDASANLPASRRIPAGTWTFNTVLVPSSADATGTARVHVKIHRRSAAGALTNIASGYSAATAFVAATESAHAISVASVPEQILGTGETIQLEFHIDSRGVAVVNQVVTFRIGNASVAADCQVNLPSPGLGYHYPRSLSATLTATAAIIKRAIKAFTTTGTFTATATKFVDARRSFSATTTPTTAIIKRVGKPLTVTLTGTTAIIKRVGKPFSSTLTGTTAIIKLVRAAKSATMTGTASMTRAVTAARAFTATLTASASIARSVIAVRAFAATLTATASITRFLAAKRAFSATATGSAAAVKRLAKAPLSATMSATAAFARSVTAVRAFSSTTTPTTVFARSVISARAFSSSMVATATGAVRMPFTALNRIVGGGGTTVKKVITYVFDD